MTNEKLGQEPAFAYQITLANGEKVESIGMSKRFYAACAAMQGLLSASYYNFYDFESDERYIKKAYSLADELLKQENI